MTSPYNDSSKTMTILLVKPHNATTTTNTGVLDVCLNHANCIACSSSSQLTSMYSFKEGFPMCAYSYPASTTLVILLDKKGE